MEPDLYVPLIPADPLKTAVLQVLTLLTQSVTSNSISKSVLYLMQSWDSVRWKHLPELQDLLELN